MYRNLIILLLACLLSACGQRKANLASDETAEPDEFIASFQPLKLPYVLKEEGLAKEPEDSLLINRSLLSKFVPDSVFLRDFKKGEKYRVYAIGSISVKDGETYLMVRASGSSKSVAYLLCFDQGNIFRASMGVLRLPADKRFDTEFSIDRKYVMYMVRTRRSGEGQLIYRKDVFVYNTAGVFTLVMTESNEEVEEEEVYNPIDTLPVTRALSGDYVKDKKNFISIRDGRSDKRLLFFLHMEKNNGDCTGELRGELDLVKPGLAQYNKADDHCVLEFSFKGNSLAVRELEACGNHRSVRCSFNGTYTKKRTPSQKRKP